MLGVYIIAFFILFPAYRYLIDGDAIGYIGVAERVAKADYNRSINGLWSPLGSWLAVPFLKAGMDPVIAARYLNGIYGLVSLAAFFTLLNRLKIQAFAAAGILVAALFLVLHFVFFRLFGDLLQIVFLLLYMNVVCSENFSSSYKKIMLAAFIGGIGYYAKAYTFYFVLSHISVVLFYSGHKKTGRWFTTATLKKTALAITMLMLLALPWIFAIKSKYGYYALSTVGQYNMTWSLSQAYDQQKVLLGTPPYDDSYSMWEDPTFKKVTNITAFSSPKLFLFQVKLVFGNAKDLLKELNIFSFATAMIMLLSFLFVFTRNKYFTGNLKTMALVFFLAIWPAGLLLLHIEARFLWILILMLLLAGGVLMNYLREVLAAGKKLLPGIVWVITASFCYNALNELKDAYGSGKDTYQMADALQRAGVGGNIISNHRNYEELRQSIGVNYLIKSRFYGPLITNYSSDEIIKAIDEAAINHSIMFYQSPEEKTAIINGPVAKHAIQVQPDIFPGIVVLTFRK